MPKLPTAQDFGQRPEPTPARGTVGYQATTGTEGAEALATAEFGKELGRWAAVEQEKADTTRVEDAWNKYRSTALDLTTGDNGVLKLKGSEAVNSNMLPTVEGQLKTTRKAISETLSSDQRRRFEERANATDYGVKHSIVSHLMGEQQVYNAAVQEGAVNAGLAEVRANPLDEQTFEGQYRLLEGKTTAYLKSIGKDVPEVRDEYMRKIKDAMITTRIETLLYDRPEIAEARFRNLADQISDPKLKREYQARTAEVAFNVFTTTDAQKLTADTRAAIPGAYISDQADREKGLKEISLALKNKKPGDEGYADLVQARVAFETAPSETEFKSTNGLPTAKDVKASLPLVLAKIPAAAEKRGYRPGTPEYSAYVRRMEQEVTAINTKESTQLANIQKENIDFIKDNMLKIAMGAEGAQAGNGGFQKVASWSSYVQDPAIARRVALLDTDSKIALMNTLKSLNNADGKGNDTLANEFRNRLYLPADDPNRINSWTQIMTDQRVRDGTLNSTQLNYLDQEFKRSQTEDGRSYANVRKGGETLARAYFNNPMKPTKIMGLSDTAAALWAMNADKVVGEYNKAGKDIRPLFDPTNKDGLVTPQIFEQYVQQASGVTTTAEALEKQAAAVKSASPAPAPIEMPKTVTTKEQAAEWIKTLPPETPYREPGDPPNGHRTTPGKPAATSANPAALPGQIKTEDAVMPKGMLERGNIDLSKRPIVRGGSGGGGGGGKASGDATYSTVRSMSFGEDGREVLIPTVAADGSRILSNDEAIQQYRKTGQFLGKFATPEDATAYTQKLHEDQAKLYDATAKVAQPADDIPTLVEGPVLPKGARTEEQKVATAARLQDLFENSIKGGLWVASAPVRLVERGYGLFIQAVKSLNPSDEERAVTGFRALIKQGTFRANEDTVVMLNNFLASKKGSDTENAKAQKMLKVIANKLGIEMVDSKSGSGGGRGTDAMSPAAQAKYKEATGASIDASEVVKPAAATGVKGGTDDARTTGAMTAEQEAKLRALLKSNNLPQAAIDAAVAAAKRKGGK